MVYTVNKLCRLYMFKQSRLMSVPLGNSAIGNTLFSVLCVTVLGSLPTLF